MISDIIEILEHPLLHILVQNDSFYFQVQQLEEGELLHETGKLSQKKGVYRNEWDFEAQLNTEV